MKVRPRFCTVALILPWALLLIDTDPIVWPLTLVSRLTPKRSTPPSLLEKPPRMVSSALSATRTASPNGDSLSATAVVIIVVESSAAVKAAIAGRGRRVGVIDCMPSPSLEIVAAGHQQGERRQRVARERSAERRRHLPFPVLAEIELVLGVADVGKNHQEDAVPDLLELLARHELGAERRIADQHLVAAHPLEHDEMQIALGLDQHDAGNADRGDLVEAYLVTLGAVSERVEVLLHIEHGEALFLDFFLVADLVHRLQHAVFRRRAVVVISQQRRDRRRAAAEIVFLLDHAAEAQLLEGGHRRAEGIAGGVERALARRCRRGEAGRQREREEQCVCAAGVDHELASPGCLQGPYLLMLTLTTVTVFRKNWLPEFCTTVKTPTAFWKAVPAMFAVPLVVHSMQLMAGLPSSPRARLVESS